MLLKLADFACEEGPGYAFVEGKELLRECGLPRPDFIATVRQLEGRGFVRVDQAMGDLGGIAAVQLLASAREWLHTVRSDIPSPRADGADMRALLLKRGSISIGEIADAKAWGIQRAADAVDWLCSKRFARRVRTPANTGQHQIECVTEDHSETSPDQR